MRTIYQKSEVWVDLDAYVISDFAPRVLAAKPIMLIRDSQGSPKKQWYHQLDIKFFDNLRLH